jgi:hypothetical protein
MTAITLPTTDTTVSPDTTTRPVWRTGARAGVVAALATTAIVAIARAIDVPVNVDGEAIPLLGFAQMTLVCTALGVGIAKLVHRRTRFVATTLALTALSFVPDLTASTGAATKITLMLTHVAAAAIVIPALASRLGD